MDVLTLVLVVRLYDAFGVPAGDLRKATDVAAHTLGEVGITLRWVPCSPAAIRALGEPAAPCEASAPAGDEVSVRIGWTPPRAPEDRALGYAAIDRTNGRGALATIFMDRVRALARQADLDEGNVLGRAIAHELGHLLLGSTSHPSRGLMRAAWSVGELHQAVGVNWTFSPDEAAKMRARTLTSRVP